MPHQQLDMHNDTTTSLVYDHYKDSCSIASEAIKRRDRSMLFVLIILGLFAFQSFFPAMSNVAVNDFLNFKFGLTLQLNFPVVGNVVWFLLLIFTLRYFQVAVFVERQHCYVHKIEEQLNKTLSADLITREGKSYLSNYPHFSNWLWMLYTIIFPVLLLLATGAKMIIEFKRAYIGGWSFNFFLDATAFVLLAVSIILYLLMLHSKKKK